MFCKIYHDLTSTLFSGVFVICHVSYLYTFSSYSICSVFGHVYVMHRDRELSVIMHVCFSELERLSNLVGRPSESHPLHNSGLLSLDPVQDKTPLYSQLLQAYKWSNKVS